MATSSEQLKATREAWFNLVARKLEPYLKECGYAMPPYRLSVGFPSGGRRSKSVGECWDADCSGDKHNEIFIHPGHDDPIEVVGTLIHEMGHACVGMKYKHGPVFKKYAHKVGLEGPMRSTSPNEKLVERIKVVVDAVGPYPHAKLDSERGLSSRGPKQKGRMLKAECPECHYIIRASRSCFEIGVPPCPNPDCSLSYLVNDECVPMLPEEVEVGES